MSPTIHHSSTSISELKKGDYLLRVNSIWDFKARDVCFLQINNSVIGYDILKVTSVTDDCSYKTKKAVITKKIIEKLTEMEYVVNDNLLYQTKSLN